MSTKEQRRQKKLAKKRSKEIVARKEQAREKNQLQSFAGKFRLACNGEVDRCLVSNEILQSGRKLGTVIIARRMPDGRLGCVRILVDGFCLGVKAAHADFIFPGVLSDMLDHMREVETFRSVTPSFGRKLVEGSIAYARKFGLEPAACYKKYEPIWGDIDVNDCATEFQFGGDDGKPCYISGPNDTMKRTAEVLAKLEAAFGEGNFSFDIDSLSELDTPDDWYDDLELDRDIDEDVEDSPLDRYVNSEEQST
jgi:hypothetical protein